MQKADRTRTIYPRTPESAAMLRNVKRAMATNAALNRLTFIEWRLKGRTWNFKPASNHRMA